MMISRRNLLRSRLAFIRDLPHGGQQDQGAAVCPERNSMCKGSSIPRGHLGGRGSSIPRGLAYSKRALQNIYMKSQKSYVQYISLMMLPLSMLLPRACFSPWACCFPLRMLLPRACCSPWACCIPLSILLPRACCFPWTMDMQCPPVHASPPGHAVPPQECCFQGHDALSWACCIPLKILLHLACCSGHAAASGHGTAPWACCSPMHAALPWALSCSDF